MVEQVKQRKTEKNTEKQGESRKNMGKKGKREKNTEKQGESEENIKKKHGKTGRIREK